MSSAMSSQVRTGLPGSLYRYRYLLGAAALILLVLALRALPAAAYPFPESWNLHLREPIDQFRSWVIANRNTHWLWLWILEPFSGSIDWTIRRIEDLLLWLPWPLLVLGTGLLGLGLAGWRTALLAIASLLFTGLMGLWTESLQTLALMGVSVAISLLVGIPLGVLAARSDRFDRLLKPLLDAMQTMPAFVYLIPVLLFFGIARVPSVVATVIYALPPAIRLTNLGIRQVPTETIEAARSFGSTWRQLLFKVQIPLAMPTIMAGVNQTIMMALSIVVIAALIGAGGLGREVLVGLQRLRVGQAFEAGLAIVLMAMVLDRLSYALTLSRRRGGSRTGGRRLEARAARFIYLLGFLALIIGVIVIDRFVVDLQVFPPGWRLSLREPVDAIVRWMRDHLYEIGDTGFGTGPVSDALTIYGLTPLRSFFQSWLPWPAVVLLFAGLAASAGGLRLAAWSAAGLVGIGLLGMWSYSMDTLSQVIVAVVLSVAIAVPLGILAARSDTFETLLRPVLDFLQTIPPFVYLVPVIMLFNIGRVPGIIASVLYALPPGIRLTNLGIRQVPKETVEAASAFGSDPWQLLLKVQLPLALPSIMMGVNQTVMMVLAMVIIAGLVGGGGLGLEAVIGLAKNQTGRGVEAGLAIVLLAMILDRITQGWAQRRRGAES